MNRRRMPRSPRARDASERPPGDRRRARRAHRGARVLRRGRDAPGRRPGCVFGARRGRTPSPRESRGAAKSTPRRFLGATGCAARPAAPTREARSASRRDAGPRPPFVRARAGTRGARRARRGARGHGRVSVGKGFGFAPQMTSALQRIGARRAQRRREGHATASLLVGVGGAWRRAGAKTRRKKRFVARTVLLYCFSLPSCRPARS